MFRLLNARVPGIGELASTERAYEGDALRLRRLLELRRHAEYGRASAWSAFFMTLPGLVWMFGKLATMGSGTFWQAAPAILSAMLLGPAAGLTLSRLSDRWVLHRVRTKTVFRDPKPPPGRTIRNAYMLLFVVLLALWLLLALSPPRLFLQNLLDLLAIPAIGLAVVGAGLVTTGMFAFDGNEVVCVACSAPAPIEAGDRCGICSADLTRIETRSIGRRVRRPRLLISGLLILAAATVLLFLA